jgi:hypothetical protein
MVTAKVAPELSLALARAAGRHPAGAHVPGHAAAWLVLAGLGAACWLAYRASLWLHPFAMCRRCGGSGVTAGFVPWSRSFCSRCGGRGLVSRLGVKMAGARGRR